MMKIDLYRQSLVLSHEVYLSYGLLACYETFGLVCNMQAVKRQMLSW